MNLHIPALPSGIAVGILRGLFKLLCKNQKSGKFLLLIFCSPFFTQAQTDIDALMMKKNQLCSGIMYSQGSWDEYWEGTLKRENKNLGTVSMNMAAVMGNYGVSDKLNLLFGLPYIETKATGGTLKGFRGIQDVSLWAKWRPIHFRNEKRLFSIFAIGGISAPASNYVADYLPLSIGLRSKNLFLRGMFDFKYKTWFTTFSGTFVGRSNITIDRQAYYTTEMIYSNQVDMPNQSQLNLRMGYRGNAWIIEWVTDKVTTLGGFDITRNNMPFPSNRMNIMRTGFQFRYEPDRWNGLTLIAGANKIIEGRNIGQSTGFSAGAFYIIDFSKKSSEFTVNLKP